jgi:hypothetical protein
MDFLHIIQPQFESMHGAAQFMVSAVATKALASVDCGRERIPTSPAPVEGSIPLAYFGLYILIGC